MNRSDFTLKNLSQGKDYKTQENTQSVLSRTQVIIVMTVILKDIVPPIIEVSELGYAAVAVYSILFQSAYQDRRYDTRKCAQRRDCGGTTFWSHKAIAEKLGMGKQKVIKSIDALLDNGFIQHEGFMHSTSGSKHRIYLVVHPEMLNTVRAVIPILPFLPSVNAKRLSQNKPRNYESTNVDEDEFTI